MIILLNQIDRDISSSGKSGSVTYTFVSLKEANGYTSFVTPENAGGIVIDKAGNSMSAADRHSSTIVEIDLPDYSLIKKVIKPMKGHSTIKIEMVKNEELVPVKYIGAKKNGSSWDTVIEIDNERVSIKG